MHPPDPFPTKRFAILQRLRLEIGIIVSSRKTSLLKLWMAMMTIVITAAMRDSTTIRSALIIALRQRWHLCMIIQHESQTLLMFSRSPNRSRTTPARSNDSRRQVSVHRSLNLSICRLLSTGSVSSSPYHRLIPILAIQTLIEHRLAMETDGAIKHHYIEIRL